MIRFYSIFLFLLLFIDVFSQKSKNYYFYFSKEQLISNLRTIEHTCNVFFFDENKNIFYIGTVLEFDLNRTTPQGIDAISIGKFYYKNGLIICYDKKLNRIYKFKKIDNYAVKAMNHTAVFVKGTILYLHIQEFDNGDKYKAYLKSKDLVKSKYWNTGILNGITTFESDNSELLKFVSNNIVVDSILLNCQDSLYKVKRKYFIEKYYGNSYLE